MARQWIVCCLATAAFAALGSDAAAQASAPGPFAVRWPSAPAAELPSTPQTARLPVYDDAGEVIPFELIESRVDESGLSGAFFGGLGMAVVGALVGGALTSYDCPFTQGNVRTLCSPREDAMRSALPGALAFSLGMVGAWLGWNSDVTTWQEAVDEIREERRAGVAR